jgi:hypothetical protein
MLGEAGSGKSTYLQLRYIEAVKTWTPGLPIPVYFNLAKNVNLAQVFYSIDQDFNTNISTLISSTNVTLFIDSFDEGIYENEE